MKLGQAQPLTAAKQFLNLRANPVCAGHGALRAGKLVWQYRTFPTPLSREYAVRIAYCQGGTPNVFIDDPDLTELTGGRRLPHVYEQKPPRLCLYLPRTGEWASSMRMTRPSSPGLPCGSSTSKNGSRRMTGKAAANILENERRASPADRSPTTKSLRQRPLPRALTISRRSTPYEEPCIRSQKRNPN